MLPISSTWMFANNIYNYMCYLIKNGKVLININDEITASSLVTYNSEIVHKGAKEAMGI